MIKLTNIHKAYNQGRDNEFWALNGIDLNIEAQRVTAFCGPSGSGKTTLLTIVGCLARPTSGRVHLKERDISGLPERFLTEVRRNTFGFVFQQFNLIKGLSARDNVMLPAYPLGGDWRALHERAETLLESLKLGHRRHARVEWLSGGEQQRVAIARAMINDPQVVIADEPTANLDTALSREFMAILESLKEQGKTVLLTSHDPLVVESAVVDTVVNLRDGRLVEAPEMLFQPAIIALLLASAVSVAMLAAAAPFAWDLVRHWDITSGSERQLRLERRTYLMATLLTFVFATQLVALLLFVFNADKMAVMFVGAMCAVGTLNANAYGFPALIAQIVVFFLAAAWLVVNHADSRAYDYPLVRVKYRLLLGILPFVVIAFGLQLEYFLNLKADVITSCCGSLFSGDAKTLTGDLSALPPRQALVLFYGALVLAAGSAVFHAVSHRPHPQGVASPGAHLFKASTAEGEKQAITTGSGYFVAAFSAIAFVVALIGILSFVSLYVYEHPHHHCPFCLLKPEYDYQGYWLYVPLFAATASGLGVGAVQPFARVASLTDIVPEIAHRLSWIAAVGFIVFATVATLMILASNLMLLEG